MADIGNDVRFGWRMMRRNPGFAAVVTLACGIGANVEQIPYLTEPCRARRRPSGARARTVSAPRRGRVGVIA